jgi:tetratricopeptide (TPR) repeat protein
MGLSRSMLVVPALCIMTGMAMAAAEPAGDVPALLKQGHALVDAGNLAGASEYFARALRADPGNTGAAMALGTTMVRLGRFREALEYLEPVVASQPQNFVARNNVAWVLVTADDENLRDPGRALRLVREARALAPRDYHVLNTASEVEYACGQYDEALAAAEAALRHARAARAAPETLAAYQAQVEKCRQATEAFQLAE